MLELPSGLEDKAAALLVLLDVRDAATLLVLLGLGDGGGAKLGVLLDPDPEDGALLVLPSGLEEGAALEALLDL